MKRILAIIASVTLLLLCWEALDDITTGDQPTFLFEWMFVSLTFVWFLGLFAFRIIRQKGD